MCLLRIAGHSALNGDQHIALAVHAKEVPAQCQARVFRHLHFAMRKV